MVKKVVAGLVLLSIVLGIGLSFRARSVLANDAAREALATQLSKAIGQPVTVQSAHATIYPRVTVTLGGVSIGARGEITMDTIDVGTGLGALFSRRIDGASLRLNGARLTLPLPPLALGRPLAEPSSAAPLQLASLDEVMLNDVQLVSRGRTLRGDIDVRLHNANAATIRRIALTADSAQIDGTGEITNLAGPVGTIDLKASALDLDQLIVLASDFMDESGANASSGTSATADAARNRATPSDLRVTFSAERATMAGVSLNGVSGQARLQGEALQVDPLTFSLFGGSYAGSLGATLGDAPAFAWKGTLKNVDVAAVTAFAGNPGVITGRLDADVDLAGSGVDAAAAMKTVRGTARVTLTNGAVKNLALVKAAVAATSADPQAAIGSSQGPHDEPFSEVGATLAVAGGAASTQDLRFVSKDIRLDAAGALKLDGSAVQINGALELSEELSKEANRTPRGAAPQEGRLTLPLTITGVAGRYSIRIDAAPR